MRFNQAPEMHSTCHYSTDEGCSSIEYVYCTVYNKEVKRGGISKTCSQYKARQKMKKQPTELI